MQGALCPLLRTALLSAASAGQGRERSHELAPKAASLSYIAVPCCAAHAGSPGTTARGTELAEYGNKQAPPSAPPHATGLTSMAAAYQHGLPIVPDPAQCGPGPPWHPIQTFCQGLSAHEQPHRRTAPGGAMHTGRTRRGRAIPSTSTPVPCTLPQIRGGMMCGIPGGLTGGGGT